MLRFRGFRSEDVGKDGLYRRRRKAREQLTRGGAGAVQDVEALGARDQAFVLGARSGSGAAAGGHSGMGRAAAARTQGGACSFGAGVHRGFHM